MLVGAPPAQLAINQAGQRLASNGYALRDGRLLSLQSRVCRQWTADVGPIARDCVALGRVDGAAALYLHADPVSGDRAVGQDDIGLRPGAVNGKDEREARHSRGGMPKRARNVLLKCDRSLNPRR